ncbi:MAG: hypothetical protein ACC653_00930 [Gammaproteobacteria bacterium]
MASISDSRLKQDKIFYGKSNFEIKPGSHISVEQSMARKKIKFDIDLMALSPDSLVQVNLAWHWVVAMMIALSAIVIVFVITQFVSDKLVLNYIHYFIAVLVLLFFIFTVLFLIFSNRKRIFTTRFSKLPIIEILISNPNKNIYNSFIDSLENEIIIAVENRRMNSKQQRAGELKTLRRLSIAGVISKDDYEESKQILLHG